MMGRTREHARGAIRKLVMAIPARSLDGAIMYMSHAFI